MPKVSIIIPVYNVEQYIERCARNLFEQTLDDLEYLFIDDCSTDNSIDVLMKVLEDYPHRKRQVIIHKMDVNSGQAKVREWGIRNAKGEYTIHCDSDDSVDKTAYKVLYEKAKENNCDIVFHDYYICKGQEKLYNESGILGKTKNQILSEILRDKIKASLWMALIKRSIYDDCRFLFPRGDMTEDCAIILQVLTLSERITQIEKGLYYYYINSESISNKLSVSYCLKRFQDCVDNTALLESFFKNFSYTLSEEFDIRKLSNVNKLLPIINKRGCLSKWKNTYPQLAIRLLHTRRLTIKEKAKIALIYMGLYPVYHYFMGYRFAE